MYPRGVASVTIIERESDGRTRANRRQFQTSSDGTLEIADLLPGRYMLLVERKGFDPEHMPLPDLDVRDEALPITVPLTPAKTATAAAREGAERARQEALKAGAQTLAAEDFEEGQRREAEGRARLESNEPEKALDRFELAREAFERARRQAEMVAGDEAALDRLEAAADAARAEAGRANAALLAADLWRKAEDEATAGKEARQLGDRSTARAKLASARSFYEKAREAARAEADRRVAAARTEADQARSDAQDAGAREKAASSYAAAQIRYDEATMLHQRGDRLNAESAFEASAQAFRKAADEARQRP